MLSRRTPTNQSAAGQLRAFNIAFVLIDEFSFMAFSSAAEPLRSANRLAGKGLYSWELFSPTGGAVQASNGMVFQVEPLSTKPTNINLVLVCGGAEKPDLQFSKLDSWLRWMAANRVTIGSISTASYVLANAGLLAGYQCTIHWESLAVFRERYSSLDILDDIFVIDRDRITCSGGTAAMDMVLQLIGQHHGTDLASSVAAQFIHERVRRDGDRQVMDPRHRLGIVNPRLRETVITMEHNIENPISCADRKRLVDYQPFGHWHTQTFVACLRHDRLDAPWIINKPMNRDVFDTYIETQLAPPLRKKDVIILDNLSSHKSTKAEEILKAHGAWFLFLPPYSPDLNPIEMAFSKLKALMRKAAARSYDDLWRKVGQVCDLFSDEECFNYLKAAGYVSE